MPSDLQPVIIQESVERELQTPVRKPFHSALPQRFKVLSNALVVESFPNDAFVVMRKTNICCKKRLCTKWRSSNLRKRLKKGCGRNINEMVSSVLERVVNLLKM